jgi:hypothetical protein
VDRIAAPYHGEGGAWPGSDRQSHLSDSQFCLIACAVWQAVKCSDPLFVDFLACCLRWDPKQVLFFCQEILCLAAALTEIYLCHARSRQEVLRPRARAQRYSPDDALQHEWILEATHPVRAHRLPSFIEAPCPPLTSHGASICAPP